MKSVTWFATRIAIAVSQALSRWREWGQNYDHVIDLEDFQKDVTPEYDSAREERDCPCDAPEVNDGRVYWYDKTTYDDIFCVVTSYAKEAESMFNRVPCRIRVFKGNKLMKYICMETHWAYTNIVDGNLILEKIVSDGLGRVVIPLGEHPTERPE